MIIPKVWGFEDEVVNAEYCGKRMMVWEQYRSSIHKHDKKDETLMVHTGLLWFETGSDPASMTGTWLRDNERIRLLPGTWHRFSALRDTLIMEFSTHHDDADSIRDEKSGKIDAKEFRALLADFYRHENQENILTVEQAGVIAGNFRAAGRKLGMVNGCFDLMHLGHVELLRQAKARCEILFAAVNSDNSVRSLKGKGRPFVDEIGRWAMVEANKFVDYVVQAQNSTCLDVVDAVHPDIYVTTTEHGMKGPEAVEVIKYGGAVEVIEMIKGYNTTNIAAKVTGTNLAMGAQPKEKGPPAKVWTGTELREV
jgi:rfaE bifunctional protein nucleotidyltransferase chain/domain